MKDNQYEAENRSAKKVLLVDDIPKNLQLLSEILTNNDYEVSTAINGLMALRYLETHKPDVILLDIKMPEMDGFEVCRKIKSDERIRHLPA